MGKGAKQTRKGKTNNGRVIITTTGEEPKSARRTKGCYRLWKFAETLNLDEIEMLITKRRQDIKHLEDVDEIRKKRTEILILEDTYRIVRRRVKLLKKDE